jgi:N-carbamoylputrescine amidase
MKYRISRNCRMRYDFGCIESKDIQIMITKIGLIQMICSTEAAVNLAAAMDRIRDAAARGAQVICLPELFKTRYFCQSEDHAHFSLAEKVPGPTTERLGALARELEVVLIVPLFERRAAGVYHNTAAVIDADGTYLGKYRKMHIPDDPLFYEKFYFAPGDLGFMAWDTRFGRIGVLICWDQWYPEAARLAALHGARILLYPTAIGWHPSEKAELGKSQHDAWETIQRGHAIANGIYVAAVNRTGFEGDASQGIEFWGGSFACDPAGTLLAKGSHDKEETLIVSCDLKDVDRMRTHWPFLRDRRLDAYQDITLRYLD